MEKQSMDQVKGAKAELTNGMKRFADEVSYPASDRINQVKEDISDAISKGKTEFTKLARKDLKKMQKLGNQMADFGANSLNSVKEFAQRRPMTALAIAAGVSAIAVGLMTRSSTRTRGA